MNRKFYSFFPYRKCHYIITNTRRTPTATATAHEDRSCRLHLAETMNRYHGSTMFCKECVAESDIYVGEWLIGSKVGLPHSQAARIFALTRGPSNPQRPLILSVFSLGMSVSRAPLRLRPDANKSRAMQSRQLLLCRALAEHDIYIYSHFDPDMFSPLTHC